MDTTRLPYSGDVWYYAALNLTGQGRCIVFGDPGANWVKIVSSDQLAGRKFLQVQREGVTIKGQVGDASFGYEVASTGDVNRDGYDDFWVTAVRSWGSPNAEGAVYLFLGRPDFLTNPPRTTAEAALMLTGPTPHAKFGSFLCNTGDVNDDGIDDLLVGSLHGAYLYFPFLNQRPRNVTALDVYQDAQCIIAAQEVAVGATVWVEVRGEDADPTEVNIAEVTLFAGGFPPPRGLRIRLRETGKNAGVFRAAILLSDKTANADQRRMRVLSRDTLTVQSYESPSMGRIVPIRSTDSTPTPTPTPRPGPPQILLAGY